MNNFTDFPFSLCMAFGSECHTIFWAGWPAVDLNSHLLFHYQVAEGWPRLETIVGFPMGSDLHGGISKDPCLYDVIFIFKWIPSWLYLRSLKSHHDADGVRQSSVWVNPPVSEHWEFSSFPIWLIRVLSLYTCYRSIFFLFSLCNVVLVTFLFNLAF